MCAARAGGRRALCRLCLSGEGARLAPIFPQARLHARYSAALFLTTGLLIEMEDGLPQTICWECTDLINSSLILRNQSHKAEVKLLSLGHRRSQPDLIKQNQRKRQSRDKRLPNCHRSKEKSTKRRSCLDDSDFPVQPEEARYKVEVEVKEEGSECRRRDSGAALTLSSAGREEPIKTDVSDVAKENKLYEELKRRRSEDESNVSTGYVSDESRAARPSGGRRSRGGGGAGAGALRARRDALRSLAEEPFDPRGPVRCKLCKKTVSRWSSFRTHSKLHLGFDFVCEYCGKSFISITQLRRHKSSRHGEARTLACARCGYRALDKPQLLLHERREHTGERPYVCDACGASYHGRRCLIQHIENHATARNIQCDKCPSMFKSRRHLARHTYTMHTSKKYNYKCHVCQQIYKKLKYVRQHMLKMHGLTTAQQGQIAKIRL